MEGKHSFAGDGPVFNMRGQHLTMSRHYSVSVKGSKERNYPKSLSSLALHAGCLILYFLEMWTIFDIVGMA